MGTIKAVIDMASVTGLGREKEKGTHLGKSIEKSTARENTWTPEEELYTPLLNKSLAKQTRESSHWAARDLHTLTQ